MTRYVRSRNPLPAWLVLASLAALLLSGCANSEAERPAPAERPTSPVTVSTATAEERVLPPGLDVTGTLMADAQTDVASELDLRVVQVLVERGQAVRAGAVLARLDHEDVMHQLREAEAIEAQMQARLGLAPGQAFDPSRTPDVRQARVTSERAAIEHERYASLVDDGAVSRSEYDLKRTEFLASKENVETTLNQVRQMYQALLAQRARVAMARKALADTVIRAPFDGLVAEKHVNVGQYLKKGARVATLVRVDPLRIELTIPETAAVSISPGQAVSFSVQTYPDRRFAGTIAYVGPALRADSRALVVEALVPNAGGLLRPGLFATARIALPGARPSLLVPASAVRKEAGVARLYVARNGQAEARIVQIGRDVDGLIEVVRGLRPGERVVVQAPESLKDGVPVADVLREAR